MKRFVNSRAWPARALLLAALLIAVLGRVAAQEPVPPLTGHIVDTTATLAEVAIAGLEQKLVEGGFYEPEKRPYWPHVTVARVRPEARGSRRPAVVSDPPAKLPESLSEARICRRMTFYRSVLQPRGARYAPLAQVELPG